MKLNFTGNSSFEDVDRIVDEFLACLSCKFKMEYETIIFTITVALRELLNNAVEHGNGLDWHKKISCELKCNGGVICIRVSDEGKGFDIDCTLNKILGKAHDRERARGILLIQSLGFEMKVLGSQVIAKYRACNKV